MKAVDGCDTDGQPFDLTLSRILPRHIMPANLITVSTEHVHRTVQHHLTV